MLCYDLLNNKKRAENRAGAMSHIYWIRRILNNTKYIGYGRDPDVFRRAVLADVDKHSDSPSQVEILYYELRQVFVDRMKNQDHCTAADMSFARLLMEIDAKRKEDRVYNLADTFFGLVVDAKSEQSRRFALTALNTCLLGASDKTIENSMQELKDRKRIFRLSLLEKSDDRTIFLCNSLARSFITAAYFEDKERGIKSAQNRFVISFLFALAHYDSEQHNMRPEYFDFVCRAFEESSQLCTAFGDVAENIISYLTITTDEKQIERLMEILDKNIAKNQVHAMETKHVIALMELDLSNKTRTGAQALENYLIQYTSFFSDDIEEITEKALERAVILANNCSWREDIYQSKERVALGALISHLGDVLTHGDGDKQKLHNLVNDFEGRIAHLVLEEDIKEMISSLHDAIDKEPSRSFVRKKRVQLKP